MRRRQTKHTRVLHARVDKNEATLFNDAVMIYHIVNIPDRVANMG